MFYLIERLLLKFGYRLVKIKPGSGWHPDDGGCLNCGAEQGQYCYVPCYPGAWRIHKKETAN